MSAQEHWIRCDQEMPDVDQDVLAFLPEHDILIAAWDDDVNFWFCLSGRCFDRSEVTHWRQLPDPPLVLS